MEETKALKVKPTFTSKQIIKLAELIRERGNRLEIMNGKVYEVKRTLLGEIEEAKN